MYNDTYKELETEQNSKHGILAAFQKTAASITRVTGSAVAFLVAAPVIIVWAITGFDFHFSDTGQPVIHTSTTIVTYIMAFIIQRTQNKDFLAL